MRTRRNPRTKRVRQRLLGALLICAVTVLAASAPGVATGVRDLAEAQRLVGMARLGAQAVSLSHALADERDGMAVFVAGGRSTEGGNGVSETQRVRVDRQAKEVLAAAADADTDDAPAFADATAEVVRQLGELPTVRQKVLSGPGSVEAAAAAYDPAIRALHGIGSAVARSLPARGASADTTALPELARAVDQASVQRGLLVGALTAGGGQSGLVGAAQTAAVSERSALAEFRGGASQAAVEQYDQTVTGSDVNQADKRLKQLLNDSSLSAADRALKPRVVQAALSARVDMMRGVESSLAAAAADRLAALRDDDVTALELHVALASVCFLLVLGVGVSTARSITRPAAALNRFARGDVPADEQVRIVGSDEFAATARAVNALRAEVNGLRGRVAAQDAEHTKLQGVRDALAAERELLHGRQDALTTRLGSLQDNVHGTYVNLTLRTLGLVERQLTLIERLEELVHDPDELSQLFKLDHLATRMRRNSENLLLLAGAEHGHAHPKPVPLVDVARAAVSEIDTYERVRIHQLPAGRIAGFATDDLSHLIAELLENAAAFSPPETEVQLSGWMLESGELMLSVEDQGIGIPTARLDELNALLTQADPAEHPAVAEATGIGVYVVARLAARHGIRVQLRDAKRGGTTAVVVVPTALTAPAEDPDGPQTPVEAAVAGEPWQPRKALRRAREERAGEPERTAPAAVEPVTQPTPRTQPAGEMPGEVPGEASGEASEPGGEAIEHARADRPAPVTPAPESAPAPVVATEAPAPAQAPAPAVAETPDGEGLTAKGLPQRVPRSTGLSGEPQVRGRARQGGGVDPEELRRKLGGFAQGLREGRAEAQAETQEIRRGLPAPRKAADAAAAEGSSGGHQQVEAEGVEEARG
ncbi:MULTISPECIES: nitrate- and nitrite sensing domain-containing protein [unclassified Streptomyces]|uniref:nitrate- and nitrite sensing domain-containing protein n=1 Tax=unclassified Streptomyces TaxID=2593676 RepID=UPI00039E1246|nr:nitrate- and nitrite sensing domain-containing protein [Streptomyces sp. BoleA5]MYX34422.1 histidine kinase [Streptomyces sp. SID8377]